MEDEAREACFEREIEPPLRPKQSHSQSQEIRDFKVDEEFQNFCKLHTFRLSCAVSIFIILAYILGRLNFSWTVIIILCTIAIWQWHEKLLTIQGFAYREAEIHQHRKKAFESAETAEWLNFFVNRWQVIFRIYRSLMGFKEFHIFCHAELSFVKFCT